MRKAYLWGEKIWLALFLSHVRLQVFVFHVYECMCKYYDVVLFCEFKLIVFSCLADLAPKYTQSHYQFVCLN